MNFSRPERAIILLTLLLAAFLSGWFFCLRREHALMFTPSPVQSVQPTISASPAPAGESGGRVNINTADAQTLQTLPGIGEKRASDIIAYREANGPFTIPEQLSDVPGIGSATLSEIIDLITTEE